MRRIGRALGRLAKFGLALYAISALAVFAADRFWPPHDTTASDRLIICLGGGMAAGGLSPDSRGRAEQCAAMLGAGMGSAVLVTGSGAGPLMANQIGTPPQVMLEPDARSTLQNALFAARMVDPDTPILIVTDAYHLPRAWVSYRVMGFRDIRLARTPMPQPDLAPILREGAAIWFNAARYGLWLITPWLTKDTRDALLI